MTKITKIKTQIGELGAPVTTDLEDVYEGTKADDNGRVIWYPDYDERERIQLEYYTCLQKALDEQPESDEQTLVVLAGYCQRARLEEEACVKRTHWDLRFRQLSLDVIRKVFRETYKKP